MNLAKDEPDLYRLAIAMEQRYRGGPHFRGDDFWTVKCVHKITGEKEEYELNATSSQDAIDAVRATLKDTQRPYQWKIRPSRAVLGLGRSRTWQGLDLVQLEG